MEIGVQSLGFHGHEKESLMKIKQAVCAIILAIPMTLLAQETQPVIHLWSNGAPGFESRKDIPKPAPAPCLRAWTIHR